MKPLAKYAIPNLIVQNGRYSFTASFGYDVDGKRIQIRRGGFKTKKETYEAYQDIINEFYSKKNEKKKQDTSKKIPFKKVVDDYFLPYYKRVRKVRPQTFVSRYSITQNYFDEFNTRPIDEITTLDITRWQNKLLEVREKNGKKTHNYARMVRGVLNMIFKFAKQNGIIQTNPALDSENIKKTRPKVQFITKDELERLCTTFCLELPLEFMSYVMINFLFMSGLRIGEATALTWEDLDFSLGEVNVNKTMTYNNKNDYSIGEPKTESANRIVALDHDTMLLFKDWKSYQSQLIQTTYVFSYDGVPTNKHTIGKTLTRHLKLANIKRITPHGLRHSNAAMLIKLGIGALQIQKRFGHADIKTTLNYYGHLYPESDRDLANKLTGIIHRTTSKVNLTPNNHGNQYTKNLLTSDTQEEPKEQ
ncbi:MAG: integrase-like protein [Bacillus sp. (in: firmicutes)]|jgi:integrase|nr:integrase-like protein [Bacillus sp. (in: firmicutes)]